jgi:hypothetical protein
MLRSLLPAGIALTPKCSGSILSDCVESVTLVANELVTNAAKYAFTGRDSGEVVLGYRQEGAGCRLWVHDNGHGTAPEREGGKSARTFGNLLIATLVTRLNAEIRYASEQGTKVAVSPESKWGSPAFPKGADARRKGASEPCRNCAQTR